MQPAQAKKVWAGHGSRAEPGPAGSEFPAGSDSRPRKSLQCPALGAAGTEQGVSSQKPPGALPWDPTDLRTLILPKKIQPNPGEPTSSAGAAPAGAGVGGRDSQGCSGHSSHSAHTLLSSLLPAHIPTQPHINSSGSFYLPKGSCTQAVQLSRKLKENLQVS